MPPLAKKSQQATFLVNKLRAEVLKDTDPAAIAGYLDKLHNLYPTWKWETSRERGVRVYLPRKPFEGRILGEEEDAIPIGVRHSADYIEGWRNGVPYIYKDRNGLQRVALSHPTYEEPFHPVAPVEEEPSDSPAVTVWERLDATLGR